MSRAASPFGIFLLLLFTGCCEGFQASVLSTSRPIHLATDGPAPVRTPRMEGSLRRRAGEKSCVIERRNYYWNQNLRSSSQLHLALGRASMERFNEQLPSDRVIATVEAMVADGKGSSGLVASDVAVNAGVALSDARKDLMKLAAVSQGDIAVDADGELIYKFPPNLRSVLAEKSAKYRALQTFKKVWPGLFWMIRVSFGVALLASILLVFSTIFFLQTSSTSDDDNRGRRDERGGMRGGGGFGYSSWWGPSPFDVFYYRPYYGYYAMPGESRPRDPREMGFLESVFSYIFGDGDPNVDLETKRLQLASNMIRSNNGAVTGEQLAPFCDPDVSAGDDTAYVNENFVLPIVSALDGEARVTDDGDIIYVFPDLQVSASSTTRDSSKMLAEARESMVLRRAGLKVSASTREISQLLQYNRINTRGAYERRDLLRLLEDALPPLTAEEEAEVALEDPSILQEREYKFSLASDLNKLLAGGLGIVNLGGALYLGNLLSQYAIVYGTRLPSFMGTVQGFYPLILGYAVLFNVIPLARNFWIQQQNVQIQSRNAKRRQWSNFLKQATISNPDIRRKLRAASSFAPRIQEAGKDIVYDTSRTSDDLESEKQQQALSAFDVLLGGENESTEGTFE